MIFKIKIELMILFTHFILHTLSKQTQLITPEILIERGEIQNIFCFFKRLSANIMPICNHRGFKNLIFQNHK